MSFWLTIKEYFWAKKRTMSGVLSSKGFWASSILVLVIIFSNLTEDDQRSFVLEFEFASAGVADAFHSINKLGVDEVRCAGTDCWFYAGGKYLFSTADNGRKSYLHESFKDPADKNACLALKNDDNGALAAYVLDDNHCELSSEDVAKLSKDTLQSLKAGITYLTPQSV